MREMLKPYHFQTFTMKEKKGFASIVTRKDQRQLHNGYLRSVKRFWWSMLKNIFWRNTALIVVGLELLALLIVIKL